MLLVPLQAELDALDAAELVPPGSLHSASNHHKRQHVTLVDDDDDDEDDKRKILQDAEEESVRKRLRLANERDGGCVDLTGDD